MNPTFKDICIFTRSYAGDKELLPYLYKSIEKFASNWGEVVLVVEDRDFEIIKPYVPHWVRIEVEESFAPGTIQHKYTKLTADFYTDKEFIFHIDSDSIFIDTPTLQDLFSEGKPYLEYAKYSDLLDYQNNDDFLKLMSTYARDKVLPTELLKMGIQNPQNWITEHFNNWFKGWFELWKENYGITQWRKGTSIAFGSDVMFEFSRRPEKLYPRLVYLLARNHIEKIHAITLKEFIATKIGIQTEGIAPERYFSDLNFIGAILHEYMKDQIEWIDITTAGYEHRKLFVKQFISYDILEKGALKLNSKADLNSFLVNSDRSIDIVIKSFSRDYSRLIFLLKSIKKYFSGYQKIYLFLDEEDDVRLFAEKVYELGLNIHISYVTTDQRSGYIYQQYFKLNGPCFSTADFLLPLDSDMIFYRPSCVNDWFYEGKPFIPYGRWPNLESFPPNDLITNVIINMPQRTHDLSFFIDHLIDNFEARNVVISNFNGETLSFTYKSNNYELSKKRLHDTWISCIRDLTVNPIDAMRAHFIFSVSGLNYVRKVICDLTKLSFQDAIFDIRSFPTFSEYQIYGNIMFDNKFYGSDHIFLEGDNATVATNNLPIIKCNSRMESAFDVYVSILDGDYENFNTRSEVLKTIRALRRDFIGEDWG